MCFGVQLSVGEEGDHGFGWGYYKSVGRELGTKCTKVWLEKMSLYFDM